MKVNSPNYLAAVSLIAALLTTITIYPDVYRVAGPLQMMFLVCKFGFILATVALSWFFYKKPQNQSDLPKALLFTICIAYCLSMMWFLPLYEAAYLQCAIGCAFVKTRRQWLFPAIFGSGIVGFIAVYEAQDLLHWSIPPPSRKDWITIILFFFLLTWLIQKYAINTSRRDKEKLLRLSRIGHETQRLLHDVKGMLSSPILIFESINDDNSQWTFEGYKAQVKNLSNEMKHVRDVLRSINLMSKPQLEMGDVCISRAFANAVQILERRLMHVQLHAPESRVVHSDEDVLRSVFFNLLLNSLEAFERNKAESPAIRVSWSNGDLLYQDNAGTAGVSEKDGGNSGIGLELASTDLNNMGVLTKISFESNGLNMRMRFPSTGKN